MSSIDISSTYFCGSNTQDIHYVACDTSSIETLCCTACGTNKRNVKEYISYGHKTNICSYCKEYSDTTSWYDSDFTPSGHLQRWYR